MIQDNSHKSLSRGLMCISVLGYLYLLWDFLIGRTFFSSDFYHIHLTFELGFKSLDHNLRLPTWLPFFSGGKALFGDMANSYSPYSIDFILTYLITKLFALDAKFGLVLINSWRMALLNVVFALGCRKLARETLKSSLSAELVFLITLFSGAFFLPHRPIFVIANYFSPWILYFATRFFTRPRSLLNNAVGFTLCISLAVFHQFTIQTTLIFPYIILYLVGLVLFAPDRQLLWQSVRAALRRWQGVLVGLLLALTMTSAVLPHLFSFGYFKQYNQKMYFPTEPVDKVASQADYDPHLYGQERFEWQKILSLFFAYPKTLEAVTDVKQGIPGHYFHNFQYFGVLAALLMLIGLIRTRNRFWAPVIFAIGLYILFATVARFPLFSTAFNIHYPMTRHFLFTLLHLSPLLGLLAGMGMDVVLEAKGRNEEPSRQSEMVGIFATLALPVIAVFFVAYKMIQDSAFGSVNQGFLFSAVFLGASMLILYRALNEPEIKTRVGLIFTLVLIDLLTFNHIVLSRIVNSGRSSNALIYEQSVNYDHALPDVDELDTYMPFTPLPPEAYFRWEAPTFYFPKLFKYALIANRSYYEMMLNSAPATQKQVSGYTMPRLRFADQAVLDPSGDLAKDSFKNPLTSFQSVIFLNSPVSQGPLIPISDVAKYPDQETLVAGDEMSIHDLKTISSNLTAKKGDLSDLLGNSNTPKEYVLGNEIDDHLWFQVDLGQDHSDVVNYVTASSREEKLDIWSIAELMGSHDGSTWEHCGFLTIGDVERKTPTSGSWMTLNQKPFRYFRVLIRGRDVGRIQNLVALQFGKRHRTVMGGNYSDYHLSVPVAQFEAAGESGKFTLLNLKLPHEEGVGLTTYPAMRFAYKYDLKMDGSSLKPTWGNDWYQDGLFQISHKQDGVLTINVPSDKLEEFKKRTLEVSIQSPTPGLKILDYGTDNLDVLTNRSKDGWLYFADSWDPYWTVSVDGKKAELAKANLQFQAVYVPKGQHTVEFKYQPRLFYLFIFFGYAMQFLCLAIVAARIWQCRTIRRSAAPIA